MVMKVSLERLFCKVGRWMWWQNVIELVVNICDVLISFFMTLRAPGWECCL
jgi:hypothetical protein